MFRRKFLLVSSLLLAMTASTSVWAQATVQASNLAFPTVAGGSIRMTWTRGDGDGVIVVMRLTATGITAPQDGTDYTANPDYLAPPPELPTSSGNFVVYKGPGTSVLVTGLTMTTGYSVAVYEYTGTGASTDYLLTTPAELSQATTDYAVHNYDNRVDCDDCHNHGAFGARDTELKAICETCHNPLGLASNKLEFDNHVTPTKNPGVDFVDCGMCHELHNLSATNTTESFNDVTSVTQHNKSFLRANVDKYVSTASPPAYLHTDTPLREDPHPDAPQAADNPDRAVEGGNDVTATGYCQVCHSLTNYHRSTNTAAAEQCHDGGSNTSCVGTEVNCGSCHEHNNNFAGAGGSCIDCHNSVRGIRPVITTQFDRNSKHIPGGTIDVTQEDCLVCHDQSTHTTQTVRMVDADNASTIYSQSTPGASTLATGQGEAYEQACLSCHDLDGASRLSGSVDQTPLSPFTNSGAPPVIDETGWISASHSRPVATSGSSPVTCVGDGTNGCHGSGHGSEQQTLLAPAGVSPAGSMTDFCYVCHDSDGPSGIDITAQFDTGTNFQAVAAGGALVNQRHDITAADQTYSGGAVTCKDCHRPHEDAAEEIVFVDTDYIVQNNPVGNPDTGAPLAVYSIGNSYAGDATSFTYFDSTDAFPDLDPTNPEGGTLIREPDYIEFCLVCHDGTAPAGVTMPGAMLNMADSYRLDDQHGRLEGRSSSSRGYLKQPWSNATDYAAGNQPGGGNSTYAALNCTLCHGAHGSGNVFNLRTSITVNGQPMTVGGKEAFMDPALCTKQCTNIDNALPEFGSTTYTLPAQENLSWGAWCTFCHEPSHGTTDGTGCQAGHLHGGGNF